MGSYGEELRYGAQMAAQRASQEEARREAAQRESVKKEEHKKKICALLNSHEYYARHLNPIKERYTNYEQLSYASMMKAKALVDETQEKLDSIITAVADTFNSSRKDRLKKQLNDLNDKYLHIYTTEVFVNGVYSTYISNMGINEEEFPVSEFFSYLLTCEVVNTNDTLIKNKYLKYKQKYLNLKNKLN